jgi:hypothetical protein
MRTSQHNIQIYRRLCLQLGTGLTAAVAMANSSLARPGMAQQLPLNITGSVIADAALAGTMLAAKSCGPPNSLSSGR